MADPRLRLFSGPDEAEISSVGELSSARRRVTVTLREILPLLADAVRSRRAWLHDFADDEVTISDDLYDVLMAYRSFRRPSA